MAGLRPLHPLLYHLGRHLVRLQDGMIGFLTNKFSSFPVIRLILPWIYSPGKAQNRCKGYNRTHCTCLRHSSVAAVGEKWRYSGFLPG